MVNLTDRDRTLPPQSHPQQTIALSQTLIAPSNPQKTIALSHLQKRSHSQKLIALFHHTKPRSPFQPSKTDRLQPHQQTITL
jgi:hypothetical protein